MEMDRDLSVLTSLPGRQWVGEVVSQAFDHLEDPTEPILLTLRGSPGGGKTAALGALRAALDAAGIPVLGPWDASAALAASLPAQMEAALAGSPPGQRGALLVDNLDALLWANDGEPFFEFERRVAYPLARRKEIVLAATSRVDLPWREYAVRVRHRSHALPALTAAEVALATRGGEEPAAEAYARTLGHPQSLDRLRRNPRSSAAELAWQATEGFLAGLPPQAAELAHMASLTLVFDVALLRQIAPTILADDSDGYYLEQIRHMRRAGLVNWEVGVGYRFFDSAARRLLARSLSHQSDRCFEEFHVQAWDYYQDDTKGADFLPCSLINAVYHRAQMYRALGTRPAEAGARCAEWVAESLPQWQRADWAAVLAVWQSGMGDRLIREELIELLGQKAYHRILDVLQEQAPREVH